MQYFSSVFCGTLGALSLRILNLKKKCLIDFLKHAEKARKLLAMPILHYEKKPTKPPSLVNS